MISMEITPAITTDEIQRAMLARAEELMQGAIAQAYSAIIASAPVRTGRFRSSISKEYRNGYAQIVSRSVNYAWWLMSHHAFAHTLDRITNEVLIASESEWSKD